MIPDISAAAICTNYQSTPPTASPRILIRFLIKTHCTIRGVYSSANNLCTGHGFQIFEGKRRSLAFWNGFSCACDYD